MEREEKFCLKWNDYSSNLEKSFRDLRTEKILFDVTLACENTQVEAHKVVLSACSNFFKDILKNNPHPHPLLYLRGIKLCQLTSLLEFMYNGEVNMGQSDLTEFLAVSGDLEVKGLTPDGDVVDKEAAATPPVELSEPPPSSPPAKRKKVSPSLVVRHDLGQSTSEQINSDGTVVKTEKTFGFEDQLEPCDDTELTFNDANMDEENDFSRFVAADDFKFDQNTPADMYDEHNAKVDLMVRSKMMETGDGWACSACVFSGTIRKVYQHVELNHVSVQYYCQICQKVCKTRNSLFCHRYRYHRNKTQSQGEESGGFSPPNKTVSGSLNHALSTSHTLSTGQAFTGIMKDILKPPSSNYILAKIENK